MRRQSAGPVDAEQIADRFVAEDLDVVTTHVLHEFGDAHPTALDDPELPR